MAVGKIKNCVVCGDVFEDRTKPKNKKTCSKMCAKQAKNKHQRIKYREENPPKPTQREIFYRNDLEYPYWTDSKKGDNDYYSIISPNTNKVEYIQARQEIEKLIGGRIRHREKIDYNGDEKGSHGVRVEFVKHEHTEPSKVKTYIMTPEELSEYRKKKC